MTGNKGSVAIRFNFNDTSFAFINVHQEAGKKATAERLENVRQIYNDTFNDFAISSNKCYHDYKCYFGDTNFRIELPDEQTRELVAQQDLARLLQYDQYYQNKDTHPVLKNLVEGPISFNPTYRYDLHSNNYDTSPKMRAPAWTDRIMMCRDRQFYHDLLNDRHNRDDRQAALPEFYYAMNSQYSDHRPVLAVYRLQTVKVDKAKKD